MNRNWSKLYLTMLMAASALGCNLLTSGGQASPTPVATATTSQVVVVTAPADEVTAPAATESAVPTLCRILQPLNFRSGPGLSFEPPLRALPADAVLTPLGFSPVGFPDGQWLLLRDEGNGSEGWVLAGAQLVSCNGEITALARVPDLPPTPTPPPPTVALTATPAQLAAAPPRVNNNAPGGTTAPYVDDEVIVADAFLFRIRVADTRFGPEDGAGIDHAEFTVRELEGDTVYAHTEQFAAYCIFGGGQPDCNPWTIREGRFYWGPTGPLLQPGAYHVTILVYPQAPAFEGEVWNWDFDFWLSLP